MALPTRMAPLHLVPPGLRGQQPDLEATTAQHPRRGAFQGFLPKDMNDIRHIATLLRRNQALNVVEGMMAAALLFTTHGHDNSFDASERVLYIVCCLSNAVCLQCASITVAEALV